MAFIHSPKIVTNGLKILLDARNPRSYSGTGTTWRDLSGNNNHCVFSATPTWSSAGTFTFNGTSHVGTITNNSTLDFSSEQTVMMVVRPTATSGRRNPWNQAYAGYGTWTWEGDGNGTMNQYFGDGGGDNLPFTNNQSLPVVRNEIAVLCSTRNTSSQTWYKNGIAGAPFAHSYGVLTTTSANILIGNGYSAYFQGEINHIMAYTRALSPDEVIQNTNAIRSRFGL